jgi:hypothetical protein
MTVRSVEEEVGAVGWMGGWGCGFWKRDGQRSGSNQMFEPANWSEMQPDEYILACMPWNSVTAGGWQFGGLVGRLRRTWQVASATCLTCMMQDSQTRLVPNWVFPSS